MAVFRSTIPIAAGAEQVWAALIDFDAWPEWNPSIPSIRGDATQGSVVKLTLAMPGRPSAKVSATLTEVEPGRRLCWHGNVGGDWFFAGTREFVIEPEPDGTVRFTHVEDVSGLLFPVFRLIMGPAIKKHHDGLSAALKARAENATS